MKYVVNLQETIGTIWYVKGFFFKVHFYICNKYENYLMLKTSVAAEKSIGLTRKELHWNLYGS
jgi:hypothetical protein